MKLFLVMIMFISIFCTGLCGDEGISNQKFGPEVSYSHSDCDDSEGAEHTAGHCEHHCVHLKVAEAKASVPGVFPSENTFVSQYSFLYSDPHLEVLKRPPLAA